MKKKFAQKQRSKTADSKLVDKYSHIKYINKSAIIEPYSHIKVDNFYPINNLKNIQLNLNTIFILSHMHEDHLKGLIGNSESNEAYQNMPNLAWNYGLIYCSEITNRLMILRFPNLQTYLKPVQYGKWVKIGELS